MDLLEILKYKTSKEKRKFVLLYIFDRIVLALVVAAGAGLIVLIFQHQVEVKDAEMRYQTERQEKVAQVVGEYASSIMQMSTSLDEIDGPLSGETLWNDYDAANDAIEKLLIQEKLNKKAFQPYFHKIRKCEKAVEEYCDFIQDVLSGESGKTRSLEEYSKELKAKHLEIQNACIEIANYSSDVLYGFQPNN